MLFDALSLIVFAICVPIYQSSDQNTVQKSNVSAGESDDRVCQIISKVTYFLC